MVETDKEVNEESFANGWKAMLAQCSSYFREQIRGLSSYQMNFIRLLCSGITSDFGSKAHQELFPLGSKSNITRIKTSLIEREIVEQEADNSIHLINPVFQRWFTSEYL